MRLTNPEYDNLVTLGCWFTFISCYMVGIWLGLLESYWANQVEFHLFGIKDHQTCVVDWVPEEMSDRVAWCRAKNHRIQIYVE